MALYVSVEKDNTLWVKHIPKFIDNKNIIINICRAQAYYSVMCGYFCIRFIDFILKSKSLLD